MNKSMALSILGIAPLLTPVLLQPSNIGTLLFHGSLGLILVSVAVLTIILTIVKRRSAAKADSTGGKPTLSRSGKFLVVTAVVVVLLGQFAIGDAIRYYKLTAIQQHGRRVDAAVESVYVDSCGRHDCSLNVEYTYAPPATPPAGQGLLTGREYLASDRDPSNPRVVYAKTKGHVPIAYDVHDPRTSALNFDDSVFRDDHRAAFLRRTKVLGILLVVFLSLLAVLLMLVPTRKEPQLSPA